MTTAMREHDLPDLPENQPTLLGAPVRYLWIALGGFFVALGLAGIVLPVVPTTLPLILAAWAFAKGSPALHRWLLEHALFGPYLAEWEAHGVIPPRAKLIALSMMGLAAAWLVYGLDLHWAIKIGGLAFCLVGAVYVATRPSAPQTVHPAE